MQSCTYLACSLSQCFVKCICPSTLCLLLSIRTHTYISIHTYIHTYILTYIHTYIHTYMHAYIHMYIRTYSIHIHSNTLYMIHAYTYHYVRRSVHACYVPLLFIPFTPSFPLPLGHIPRPGVIGVSHAQYFTLTLQYTSFHIPSPLTCSGQFISWLSVCYCFNHSALLPGVLTHGCRICLFSQVALAMGFVYMRVFWGLVLRRVLL